MNALSKCRYFIVAAFVLAGCVHYQPAPISLEDSAARFEGRTLTNTEIAAFISDFSGVQIDPWPPAVWNEESLTFAAFFYHPSLETARAQWQSAAATIGTAGGRPNPVLGLQPGYSLNAVPPTPPWIPGGTIDVPIETAGKRRKRMAQAALLAESARLTVTSTAWQIRTTVRTAFIELATAEKRHDILGEQLRTQDTIVELMQQRIEAGAVSASELVPPRIARTKLQVDVAAAGMLMVQAQSRLAESIGVPETALREVRLSREALGKTADERILADNAAARRNALRHRSDLLSLLAKYEASEAALQLEIAKQYPDLHIGSGYQWDQGNQKWNLAFSVELPVLNRNQGPIAEAEAKRAEAAAVVTELQARLIGEIDRALAAYRASFAELKTARQTQAAIENQLQLARERLAAGAADQLEVQLLALERNSSALTLLDAEFRSEQASALLESALQTPLPGMQAATAEVRHAILRHEK